MTDSKPSGKGPTRPAEADVYDLPPMAFAKHLGLIIPKNSGNVSYPKLLTIGLRQYYARNTHLTRPFDLAS